VCQSAQISSVILDFTHKREIYTNDCLFLKLCRNLMEYLLSAIIYLLFVLFCSFLVLNITRDFSLETFSLNNLASLANRCLQNCKTLLFSCTSLCRTSGRMHMYKGLRLSRNLKSFKTKMRSRFKTRNFNV